MGLTCLHNRMTVNAMKDAGFNESAAKAAGLANAAVDEKQGNSRAESNLHAMCGLGQPEYDCRNAVAKIIADGKQESAEAAATGDYKLALRRMGETLHTIQDMAFHKFEPWPFAGIGDAILNAPNYMFCHLIREPLALSTIFETRNGNFASFARALSAPRASSSIDAAITAGPWGP